MKATICDFCKTAIETNAEHRIAIDESPAIDICGVCFTSSVILYEQRRVKARKPKPARKRKPTTTKPNNQGETNEPGTDESINRSGRG